jgi:hypothetical protein
VKTGFSATFFNKDQSFSAAQIGSLRRAARNANRRRSSEHWLIPSGAGRCGRTTRGWSPWAGTWTGGSSVLTSVWDYGMLVVGPLGVTRQTPHGAAALRRAKAQWGGGPPDPMRGIGVVDKHTTRMLFRAGFENLAGGYVLSSHLCSHLSSRRETA